MFPVGEDEGGAGYVGDPAGLFTVWLRLSSRAGMNANDPSAVPSAAACSLNRAVATMRL